MEVKTTTVTVEVPRQLRTYCDELADFSLTLSLSVATVRSALEEVERRYPDLYRSVCDETGAVRRHINVFVNCAYIRDRNGLDTELQPGDVLAIFPAVSGG